MLRSSIIVTALALTIVGSPTAAAAQRMSQAQIDTRGQQLMADIQNLRNQEKAAIQAATRAALADSRVQRDPRTRQAILDLERAILASRAKGDREMPAEVVGLFKRQASGRSAPPIRGKQGALNGESKIREHYLRETQDAETALRRANNAVSQQNIIDQYQQQIEAAHQRVMHEMMRELISLLRG